MNSLRKKLGGLIPSDGARDALQNVLTVEWAGHKTVLVEVPAIPGTGSGSTSGRYGGAGGEMEMSGMGRDRDREGAGRPRGEYERLDGWFDDDERAYLNRPIESHRHSSTSASAQPSSVSASSSSGAGGHRRPSAPHTRSLPASAGKKLPPLPARPTTANPFDDDEDDFFPDPVDPQHYGQMAEETEWDYPSSLSHWGGEWRPSSGVQPGSASGGGQAGMGGGGGAGGAGSGKKKENPWKVEERFGVASVTSPTFSMGSQSSKATSRESEDPFR